MLKQEKLTIKDFDATLHGARIKQIGDIKIVCGFG